jgi:hypothetical protein
VNIFRLIRAAPVRRRPFKGLRCRGGLSPDLIISLQLGRFAAYKGACGDYHSAFGGRRVAQVGRVLVERLCSVDWAR